MANCPHCGAPTAAGERFCQACGKPLDADSIGDLIDAGIVCPRCDTYNDPLRKTCIQCGSTLTGMTGYLQAVSADGEAEAGTTQPDFPQAVAPAAPEPQPAEIAAPGPAAARIVLLGETGEAKAWPVGDSGLRIGRRQGDLRFDDPHLSPQHARIEQLEGRLLAADAGSLNGTFLRVRGEATVAQGSEFLAGSQRFVLLGIGGPTTDMRTRGEHDARPYGGPIPRQRFAALRQLHATAEGDPLCGSVILLSGPAISVGRGACDLSYPRDQALELEHFVLHLEPRQARIEARAPVYLRLPNPTPLVHGDVIRIGDVLLGVEIDG
ncbi:MAG: zinc ribbon domain-containing protein [Deltaproteobacteria bacterium]|nr:zinc ribbon domain-containing protein [Deltaproteobacteria bacterium]